MKLFTLARWVTFGRGDSGDKIDFEIEVTDEQYEMLTKCADEGMDFYDIPDEALRIAACVLGKELSKEELMESLDPDDLDELEYYDYSVGFWSTDYE